MAARGIANIIRHWAISIVVNARSRARYCHASDRCPSLMSSVLMRSISLAVLLQVGPLEQQLVRRRDVQPRVEEHIDGCRDRETPWSPILVAGGVQRNASFPDGNGKMNDRISPFQGKGGKGWDRRTPAAGPCVGEGRLSMLCSPPSSRPTPWRAGFSASDWSHDRRSELLFPYSSP